jgi:hypothetical protein
VRFEEPSDVGNVELEHVSSRLRYDFHTLTLVNSK